MRDYCDNYKDTSRYLISRECTAQTHSTAQQHTWNIPNEYICFALYSVTNSFSCMMLTSVLIRLWNVLCKCTELAISFRVCNNIAYEFEWHYRWCQKSAITNHLEQCTLHIVTFAVILQTMKKSGAFVTVWHVLWVGRLESIFISKSKYWKWQQKNCAHNFFWRSTRFIHAMNMFIQEKTN